MKAATSRVEPIHTLNVVTADPDDDRILECAVASESEVVVSGDSHLLALGTFREIRILRVAEFLLERTRS